MITVIVTIFNDGKYIKNCLRSILNQSLRDIEVLVVDDGSTDDGEIFISNIIKSDDRVQLIKQEHKGLSAARNAGLLRAKGKYVTFVDGDDELLPEALRNLHRAIEQGRADAAVGSIKVVHESFVEFKDQDDWYYTVKYNKTLPISDKLIADFHCSACAALFRKSIIDANSLEFPLGLLYEDAFWHWTYFLHCKNVAFVKEPVYRYFRRAKSIMASTFDRREGIAIHHLLVIEKILEYWGRKNLLDSRYNTAEKLLNDYFWLSFKYAPDFERPLMVYECARVIRRFCLPVEQNRTLRNIAKGQISFLFPADDELKKTMDEFSRFVKIQEVLTKIFPRGTIRRTFVLKVAKYVWRLLSFNIR